MRLKADLHTHTTYSDGALSPNELVNKCKQCGLSIIAITDHDSVGAFPAIVDYGKHIGIEVISGVELSTIVEEKEVHILGYFIDFTNKQLLNYLELFRNERVKRAERIVAKLNNMNVPIVMKSVTEKAGNGAVGRPHIAAVLHDEGYIQTYHEAYEKYIGNGCPAYEKKFNLTPKDAIEIITASGGLSFLAHPAGNFNDELLHSLIKLGLDGIEVIHPSHTNTHTTYYRSVTSEYLLLESGGSDFHGGKKNDDKILGSYYVDDSAVTMMRHRLFSIKN